MTQARPFRPPSEQEIAANTAGGMIVPAEIVETAYHEYHQDLLAFLLGVLRDGHLAQDALQQTFLKLAESGGQARSETLRGWLFQVAYREAMQIRRRQRSDDVHRQKSWWMAPNDLSVDSEPIQNLIQQELTEKLRSAVQDLPVEQRQVLERRIQGEETFAEIAASMSTPLGTVLTRMRLALERLRKRLRDD